MDGASWYQSKWKMECQGFKLHYISHYIYYPHHSRILLVTHPPPSLTSAPPSPLPSYMTRSSPSPPSAAAAASSPDRTGWSAARKGIIVIENTAIASVVEKMKPSPETPSTQKALWTSVFGTIAVRRAVPRPRRQVRAKTRRSDSPDIWG